MNTRNVILFTRSPRLGMVKRRLSRDIGMSDAWIFYRRNVRVISKRLALDPRWKLWLAVTPDTFEGNEPFWPNYIPTIRQGSGDIGVRMYRCLSIFQTHPTILIGTDIPDVTADLIWQAFEKFKGNDAIFGPAKDGGYWSVGFKPRLLARNPFKGVIWSSDSVMNQTINLLPINTRVGITKRLEDIDNRKSYMSHRDKFLISL